MNTLLGDTLQNTEYQQSVNSFEIACSLLTVYLDHWDQLDEDEYKSKKHAVKEILVERLDKAIPRIKDIIVFSEVATPTTIVRYTRNPGIVYGFSQTVE